MLGERELGHYSFLNTYFVILRFMMIQLPQFNDETNEDLSKEIQEEQKSPLKSHKNRLRLARTTEIYCGKKRIKSNRESEAHLKEFMFY